MEELLKEHLGEIALLIYILYPFLKRLWTRGKKGEKASKPKEATAKSRAPKPARSPARSTPKPGRQSPPRRAPAARPAEADFLGAAQSQLTRLKKDASRLLAQAEGDARLERLVPALREDLLGRAEIIERSLRSSPTLSTIVQDTTVLHGLEALLQHLKTMARQRMYGGSSFLADADKMADACYAPILDLARAQGLRLRTSQPIAVTGDWDLSIVPSFASTRVAPLRLPVGFENNVWRWPAIAHEVAHDFYYSLEGLEPDLHQRLGLPREVQLPMSSAEVDGAWLRGLFGAWLPEIFADLIGTIGLGPAYVETMRRAFRNPGSPQQTAAILQDGSLMDAHPPGRLRLFIATRVLHHMGRHEEADELWKRWEDEHPDIQLYYLPLGGQWVGLADDAVHSIAESIVDILAQRAWPELEGFHLFNIPGFAYLHAERAEVKRLSRELAHGDSVDADVRWIIAAAVLAATEQPALHAQILAAARRSIEGIGEEQEEILATASRRPAGSIAGGLIASLGDPTALEEAIALGAALTPYKRPNWR